jgi:hypothetical protein
MPRQVIQSPDQPRVPVLIDRRAGCPGSLRRSVRGTALARLLRTTDAAVVWVDKAR